jgi:ubiquitin carboxyl-terminal hydrolase 10
MGISQSQSMQGGPSQPSGLSDASQQMLIEALPPILVLHLKRFEYNAAAGRVIKIGKRVQFSSELQIPIGTFFAFDPAVVEAENTL